MYCFRSIITVLFLVVTGLVFSAQAQDNDINFLKEKAFNGDTNAMLKIAKIYEKQGDRDKYFSWLKKAAEEGNKEAKYLFQEFELIEFKKTASPADFFRKVYPLAENGNAIAMKQLAELYEIGDGAVSKNTAEAISWYKKIISHSSDNASNTDIMLKIADCCSREKNYAEAILWYKKIISHSDDNAGNSLIMLRISDLYGRYLKNNNEAIAWAKKVLAYDNKNHKIIALCNIIRLCNQDEVAFWGQKLLEIDNSFTKCWKIDLNYALTDGYKYPRHTTASEEEMYEGTSLLKFLSRLADSGNLTAMIELGDNNRLFNDYERLAWYKKAANKGSAEGKRKYKELDNELKNRIAMEYAASKAQSNLGDEMRRYSGLEGVWHLSTNRNRAIRITLYPSSGRVKFEMWVGRAGVQWVEYPNARYESPGKIWVNGGYDFGPTTFRLSGNKLVGSNGRTYYK
ncbi:MAG: sel1 repeat family protein [Muribaculaceae bacterium]|nr:sel1 repeat family protein [Muribaculaceae bacterium]